MNHLLYFPHSKNDLLTCDNIIAQRRFVILAITLAMTIYATYAVFTILIKSFS